ncbi:hypothetical protein JG688_00018058 [Phytophthora aleatoria]|uniref:Uncharacterized protein n=1 Tax=Phytophthora aleatoria TaxID=2496075 RepID=A0A8J5M0W5_9STRA|nr:hypothetical protein JG688_00018058 [Phytophthora aleatoria]
MPAPQKFAKNGFVVLYHAIPEHRLNQLRCQAREDDSLIWFSDRFDDIMDDEDRLQAVVPDRESRELSATLKRYYKTFFPQSTAQDWRFSKHSGKPATNLFDEISNLHQRR